MESKFREVKFTDADVVNPEEYTPTGHYNPHNVCPWLLHDHGHTICVVFASSMQDALDEAVDNDKLDDWQIDPRDKSDRADYMEQRRAGDGSDNGVEYTHSDGTVWRWRDGYEPTYLGNASEPFDIEGVDVLELPNPSFSFCALFNAAQATKEVK